MKITPQRILVIGAGLGGTAMLEIFIDDPLVEIVGIVDANSQAPALQIAKQANIQIFTDLTEAIAASRPCLAFNLTGNDGVTTEAASQLGNDNVVGGFQARFIWNLLTRLKKSNEQITNLAHHDSLTGLPNRILFYDRLNQSIALARRHGTSMATLYLDLDGFKLINDSLGHDAGDVLLREAAKRITGCVRDTDTVARIGGDEFTVIICNLQTPNASEQVAMKIIDALGQPFLINGKECSVSASIGVAIYPNHGATAEQLIKIADAAMYLAKHNGKNCYRIAGN
ncbi:MAG: diguanylate cyclase [Sulfuriferula sp.]